MIAPAMSCGGIVYAVPGAPDYNPDCGWWLVYGQPADAIEPELKGSFPDSGAAIGAGRRLARERGAQFIAPASNDNREAEHDASL